MNRRAFFRSALATAALTTGLARARMDLVEGGPAAAPVFGMDNRAVWRLSEAVRADGIVIGSRHDPRCYGPLIGVALQDSVEHCGGHYVVVGLNGAQTVRSF